MATNDLSFLVDSPSERDLQEGRLVRPAMLRDLSNDEIDCIMTFVTDIEYLRVKLVFRPIHSEWWGLHLDEIYDPRTLAQAIKGYIVKEFTKFLPDIVYHRFDPARLLKFVQHMDNVLHSENRDRWMDIIHEYPREMLDRAIAHLYDVCDLPDWTGKYIPEETFVQFCRFIFYSDFLKKQIPLDEVLTYMGRRDLCGDHLAYITLANAARFNHGNNNLKKKWSERETDAFPFYLAIHNMRNFRYTCGFGLDHPDYDKRLQEGIDSYSDDEYYDEYDW